MTLAIGRTKGNGGKTRGKGQTNGFTLIELLVVIFILTLLAAMMVPNIIYVGDQARSKATEALFERITMGVDKYKDLTGFFPEDGLDSPLKNKGGDPIMSSQCIYELLGRPLLIEKPAPGGRKIVERHNSPVLDFKTSEIEVARGEDETEKPAGTGRIIPRGDIMDGWGTPIHYDRLEGKESYSVQDTPDIHVNPPGFHPLDPREFDGIAVEKMGPQNMGSYDLWSHGLVGHSPHKEYSDEYKSEEDMLKTTICNWDKPKE